MATAIPTPDPSQYPPQVATGSTAAVWLVLVVMVVFAVGISIWFMRHHPRRNDAPITGYGKTSTLRPADLERRAAWEIVGTDPGGRTSGR